MTDEQMIYISPEDDLTSVRERLEGISTKRVTLVIPAHTQLRSHVAWKLLHARAREMGKDVLIISSDPQIRSVAQAVKFKVAHSLESSLIGRSRSTGSSRPSRTGSASRGGRMSPTEQKRSLLGKGPTELRETGHTLSHHPNPANQWHPTTDEGPAIQKDAGNEKSRARKPITDSGKDARSATFHVADQQREEPYDFRIDTSRSLRPLAPEQIEEPDLFLEDFNQAQSIRDAANSHVSRPTNPSTASANEISPEPLPIYQTTPLSNVSDDPFEYMQDPQQPPRTEQRGSVSMDGLMANEHRIQEVFEGPSDVIDGQVEYQDELSDFSISSSLLPITHSWVEPAPEDEQDIVGPPRVAGVRPHSSRLRNPGNGLSFPSQQGLEEDALPPFEIEKRPTQIIPQSSPPISSKRSAAMISDSASNRAASPAPSVPERSALSRPLPQQARQKPRSTTTGTNARIAKKQSKQRQSTGSTTLVASIILFLLLIGGLAYFGPSADVTITLPSRDYSHAVNLTASAGGQQNTGPDFVSAEVQTKIFTKTGTGTATGTARVGTAAASGTVFFTNHGKALVDIPTGSIVAAGKILFATMADAVIPPSSGNQAPVPVPVPIQAQKPGEGGNVPAGSVNLIPDSSLNAIAQSNSVPVASLNLKVVNDQDIVGGGAGTATVVLNSNVDETKHLLHAQAQTDVDAWLKQLSADGIVGKPVTTDALVNPPTNGQIVDGGTFSVVLTVTAKVLFVPKQVFQAATVAQLNSDISQDSKYQNYVIVSDAGHPVQISQMKSPTGDTISMKLSYTASAKATPNVSQKVVQGWIAGKSIKDAQQYLRSQVPDVQSIDIKTFPNFVSLVPFWSGHINVIIVPGSISPK